MALTDTTVKNAKPKEKDYKLTDEKGMYLFVATSGGKSFRLDYRFAGKRKTFAIGVYPETTLKEAREERDKARKLIANNIDPLEDRRAKKAQLIAETTNTFEAIATEWFEKMKSKWTDYYAEKKWGSLKKDVLPILGTKPIRNITPGDVRAILDSIQARGAIDIAHRVKGICGEVFSYAINTDRCDRNPSKEVTGSLIPKRNKHRATITDPKEVGGLLRAIDSYTGDFVTQ